ncbi:hypothetical protein CDAR_440861 [Caerostris darwini]|uniref:Uncharacterized protein n=1 Tax=Caerostris darwini TaxID=1538125 RepID=A0AAV4RII2_9ARAC|nr:hypothetical protein CDAR_440861 [Caerostris darwini]
MVVVALCIEMLSIVEKALLVKLYYKNSESAIAALRAYAIAKAQVFWRHVKEVDVPQQRCSTVCHDSGANGAIHVGGCCTWGVQCSRSFQADRSVVRQCLESIANDSETVSLQVAT